MISFKGRHHQQDIILQCVRWYLAYSLSYRDLEELMQERGYLVVTALFSAGLCITHLALRRPFVKTRNGLVTSIEPLHACRSRRTVVIPGVIRSDWGSPGSIEQRCNGPATYLSSKTAGQLYQQNTKTNTPLHGGVTMCSTFVGIAQGQSKNSAENFLQSSSQREFLL